MEKSSTGSLDNADALPRQCLQRRIVSDIVGHNVRIVKQLSYSFQSIEQFNHPGIVIVKGTFHRFAVIDLPEQFEFFLSQRRTDFINDIQSSQRTNPVKSLRPAQHPQIRMFEERP